MNTNQVNLGAVSYSYNNSGGTKPSEEQDFLDKLFQPDPRDSPADTYGSMSLFHDRPRMPVRSKKEKSWWDKRRERMKKYMEEQLERARREAAAQSVMERRRYLNKQLENCHRLHCFLVEEKKAMDDPAPQFGDTPAAAAVLYEDLIKAYGQSAEERS